jgi:hypothetical protein
MSAHDPVLAESIRANRCPDCGNWGFLLGSRGGSTRNIFCANPKCRSGFNVMPRGGQVLFCYRISKGGEQLYPPLVHVLSAGRPLLIHDGCADRLANRPLLARPRRDRRSVRDHLPGLPQRRDAVKAARCRR